jgi:hypothetical protein
MRRRGLRQIGVITALACAAIGAPGRAMANECDPEQSKFVETTTGTTYGNKTAMYAYERLINIWCGSVANTTFWLLGNGGFDYLEAGTRQWYGYPDVVAPFYSYMFYPTLVYHQDPDIASRRWLAFQTRNSSGTSHYLTAQWGYGLVPTSYTTLVTTPYAPANFGLPMSEISRYGGSSVYVNMSVDSMKYRTSSNTWPLWPALRCDVGNTIMDWDGVRLSNNSWETQHHAILAGGC